MSEDLKQLFPHGSKEFFSINPDSSSPNPIVERGDANEPMGTDKAKKGNTGKYVVRVTGYRVRLLDEDNFCEKFHVDALRYAGIIPSDAPDKAHIIPLQKKVEKKTQEKTLIEIEVL